MREPVTLPSFFFVVLSCLLPSVSTLAESAPRFSPEDVAFFEKRVRPVLAKRCYECHSRASSEIAGGLLLDQRGDVLKGGDSGPAVVLGHSDQSRLMIAVRYEDESLQMPPTKRLELREIEVLDRWIQLGLPWGGEESVGLPPNPVRRMGQIRETHWAFQPIRRPPLPASSSLPAHHPIDMLVDAEMMSHDLTRSPRADRRTLHKRASLDLIGLPPTFEQLESFAGDESPEAWERVIDRLLADPRFGRRWGRHWLDVARYSDTKGYVDAGERRYPFAWTYRDYVIRAVNEDLPFHRFIVEQIAADRLKAADKRTLAALGYLTVGSRYNFFPHEIVDDRIDVVARGLMGLTVACARCHDHKFDPIPTKDYYRLYSVFASSKELLPHEMPRLEKPAGDREKQAELAEQLALKAQEFVDHRNQLHRQIMHEMRAWSRDYLVYIVQLMPQHRTESQPGLRTSRGLIREVTAYGRGGVGRWRRFIESRGEEGPVFGLWNRLVMLPRESFAMRTRGEIEAFAAIPGANSLVVEAFRSSPPAHMVAVAETYGKLLEDTELAWQQHSKLDSGTQHLDDAAREQLRQILYGRGTPATLSIDESEDLYHLDEHTEVRKRFAEVERVYLSAEGVERRAMTLVDRIEPVDVHVFRRGDPEQPGDAAPRGFLEIFPTLCDPQEFRQGSGRLSLAKAIVHPHNPLTARVIVNRVWSWHFGAGLVRTPSDFGTRSRPPSHPQLLDWLAADLIEHGWSLKHLHRRIMTSQTYQQASRDRVLAREKDPSNQLLWRFNRRRLEFEAIRDSMLFVADRLGDCTGGPPNNAGFDEPTNSTPSVFCLLDRELLPGLLRSFDFPSPDISNPRRSQTTGPQQSLFLLNSPFVIARATEVAAKAQSVTVDGDECRRIVSTYRIVFGREPDENEMAMAQRFIHSQRDRAPTDEAAKMVSLGPWEKLAHALLQTNEFLFLE